MFNKIIDICKKYNKEYSRPRFGELNISRIKDREYTLVITEKWKRKRERKIIYKCYLWKNKELIESWKDEGMESIIAAVELFVQSERFWDEVVKGGFICK